MWKLIGGVLGSALGGLFSAAVQWFLQRAAINDAQKQGRTEQANVDLQAASQASKESQDVENRIAAASDDDRERLRRKWTRSGGG
jgi:hypothetical protein